MEFISHYKPLPSKFSRIGTMAFNTVMVIYVGMLIAYSIISFGQN